MSNMKIEKLDKVFSYIKNGANIKQGFIEGGYPITRIETIADGTINKKRMGYAGILDIDKYKSYILNDGDILMSHINSVKHLGKVAIYKKKDDETIIHGMNLLCLKTESNFSNYLYYFFKSEHFKKQIPNITKKSVNQASFTISGLKEMTIPLPLLTEQKQIASVLDKATGLITLRKQQLEKLDLLIKSRFIEMFGDPVINEKGWIVEKISETVAPEKNALKAGPFGSSLKKEFYVDHGYKIYGQEQVIKNNALWGNYYITEKKYQELYSCRVQENDILISLVGTYGKVLIIPKNFQEGIINPRLLKITFDKEKIDTTYFKYFFTSDRFLYSLSDITHGGTMPILNLGIVKNIKLPIPPLPLQQQFSDFVEHVETLKSTLQKSLALLEMQYKALMQKYFEG